ncbi:hypothetical protein ALC56_09117, partial [Trachymyrmex septentrionalis]
VNRYLMKKETKSINTKKQKAKKQRPNFFGPLNELAGYKHKPPLKEEIFTIDIAVCNFNDGLTSLITIMQVLNLTVASIVFNSVWRRARAESKQLIAL